MKTSHIARPCSLTALCRRALVITLVASVAAAAKQLSAQSIAASPGPAVSIAMEAQVTRARGFIEQGDGARARAILDSLVNAAPLASFDLAEALYWRAVMAEHIVDAEKDWKRLVIEAPLSPRTPDALLRLGELDMLRGHPAEARVYFEQVMREFPDPVRSTRSTLWLVRSYFDERNMPRGCEVLGTLPLNQVPDGELQLQTTELQRRCTSVVTTGAAAQAAPSQSAAPGVSGSSASASASAPAAAPASAAGTRYSVQLAAYNTRAEADAAVARFKKAGITARVDGKVKPFRVRTGNYQTRAEAASALAGLKKKGHNGFVAEMDP